MAAKGEVIPGLLPAPLQASWIDAALLTAGSMLMALRGLCCLSAVVSSDTPNPSDGLVIRLSASSNSETVLAPLTLLQRRHTDTVSLPAASLTHARAEATESVVERHICRKSGLVLPDTGHCTATGTVKPQEGT